MDDIWRRNEALFRRLYQEERKTLVEVKEIVEAEPHCFPEHRISVYETRLRDVLGLRKKLKKEDWVSIHRYTIAQGLHHGEYDIFLNDTRICPKKAWKEIRRNRCHGQRNTLSNNSLPPGVRVLRRPMITSTQPEPSSATTLARNHQPAAVASNTETELAQSQPLQTWGSFSAALYAIDTFPSFPANAIESTDKGTQAITQYSVAEIVARNVHETLPWNHFRMTVLGLMFNRKITYEMVDPNGLVSQYMPNDGFFPVAPGSLVSPFADSMYPSRLGPNQYAISHAITSDQLVWYQQLARLGYMITEGIGFHLDARPFIAFARLLGQQSPEVVFRISGSCRLFMRAVWDAFVAHMQHACSFPRDVYLRINPHIDADVLRKAFTDVIRVVLATYPEWIQDSKEMLLMVSAWLGSPDLVTQLLNRGATASYSEEGRSTIVCAAEAGLTAVMKRLVSTIDINAPITTNRKASHFSILVQGIVNKELNTRTKSESDLLDTLNILLASGANADDPYPFTNGNRGRKLKRLHGPWPLSCIEVAFYYSHRAYAVMAEYSSEEFGVMTRLGVCVAASTGHIALEHYMTSRTSPDVTRRHQLLKLVLLHTMLIPFYASGMKRLNARQAKIIRVLLQYGVCPQFLENEPRITEYAISAWLGSVKEYGLTDDLQAILVFLRMVHMEPEPLFWENSIEENGTLLLTFLREHNVVNQLVVRRHGPIMLTAAALNENTEAITWLLEMGADINAPMKIPECLFTGSCIAFCFERGASIEMCRHLVRLGAKLRLFPSDKSCARLLCYALDNALRNPYGHGRTSYVGRTLGIWNLFQEYSAEVNLISMLEWRRVVWGLHRKFAVWKDDKSLAPLFHFLLSKTAEPGGTPPLIFAIRLNQESMVRTLLASEVDVNEAYADTTPLHAALDQADFQLAKRLIDLGANIKILRRRGFKLSDDALSTACFAYKHDPATPLARQARLKVIQLLIEKGADINGGHIPASPQTLLRPPLSICALLGDLEAAALLLKNGADPNVVRSLHTGGVRFKMTALDDAVRCGRLNMTQLLLKSGGMSAAPGRTGFDGALDIAAEMGHNAIAELMWQHIHDLEMSFGESAGGRARHEAIVDNVQSRAEDAMAFVDVKISIPEGQSDEDEWSGEDEW